MKESIIENKICEYATKLGFLQFKFSSPAHKGVPDRIFIKNGLVFFIEFKALGKKQTELQKSVRTKIKAQLIEVFIVDNLTEGYQLIDKLNGEII